MMMMITLLKETREQDNKNRRATKKKNSSEGIQFLSAIDVAPVKLLFSEQLVKTHKPHSRLAFSDTPGTGALMSIFFAVAIIRSCGFSNCHLPPCARSLHTQRALKSGRPCTIFRPER